VPAPALFSWSGWYIGVNAGGVFGRTDPSFTIDDSLGRYYTFGLSQSANVQAVSSLGTSSFDNSGFTGGGQIGYNWQFGHVVFGGEVDFEYFNPKGSNTLTGTLPAPATTGTGAPVPFTITNSSSGDWLSTFRARIGIANNNWLFYGTFGPAIAQVNFSSTYADGTTCPPQISCALRSNFSSTKTVWGVAGGGGVEYAFTRNWLLRAEYLYVQLDQDTDGSTAAMPTGGVIPTTCPPTAGGFCSIFKYSPVFREHIVRAALNYRFN
jgi:outer membrane immunogenic protein